MSESALADFHELMEGFIPMVFVSCQFMIGNLILIMIIRMHKDPVEAGPLRCTLAREIRLRL